MWRKLFASNRGHQQLEAPSERAEDGNGGFDTDQASTQGANETSDLHVPLLLNGHLNEEHGEEESKEVPPDTDQAIEQHGWRKFAFVDNTSVGATLFGLFVYSLSTVFTTAMSITAKLVGAKGIPVFEITLFRGLVCLVCIIPSLIRDRANPLGNRKQALLLRGLLGFGSGAALYGSVQYLPLADATVLSFLAPLWVALTGPLLIKEYPSRVVWFILPVCIGGVMLVAKPTFLFKGVEHLSTVGMVLGCSQAIFTGSVRMVVRDLRKSDLPSVIIFYLAATTVVLSVILCATLTNGFFVPKKDELMLLLATGCFAFGNQMSMTYGLRYTKASTAVALQYLSIIWAEVASIVLFNDVPGVLELIGTILIGLCTALLTIAERRKQLRHNAQANQEANPQLADASKV